MKTLALTILLSLGLLPVYAQSDNPKYDKVLSESLGGDDYGMKRYVLVILKTGPNTSESKESVTSLFQGHMENIGRLAAQKKLVVAGPLHSNEKAYRGIFILDVKTKEEASQLLDTDPAVKSKLLEAELFEWYGSAALPVYLESHEKIEKKRM
ncbi:YciI family protein [Telluribacter sp.]|jgi:uncharacterized protein YciI|uniref:YciI family protein n=1 Tax=Telluribacter sp. TaxID=1978767 RepID=UPI002E106765|nr:YciI family protein [Telluribacter sp.]